MEKISDFFLIDQLAIVMISLVSFVGISVASFAGRYLKGDEKYTSFYLTLAFLILSVFLMVSANHVIVFLLTWLLSNLLLVKLMIHKSSWKAAFHSGILAAKNFLFGFIMISASIFLLYEATGKADIQGIINSNLDKKTILATSIFLFLGAMTQSAIWPFHRWLTSSLNSPTPVSAIMHAGLVNGGGFLLTRFFPIFKDYSLIFDIILIFGLFTALLGTFWKLMQSDVKRMLACSTMGQMGFMIMQCGLGLFPAAIAHLCWHGLFKAYLFLASGSAAQEKRLNLGYPPELSVFSISMLCGALGSFTFALSSHKNILGSDTNLFLIFIAFIASTQFAIPILKQTIFKKLPLALIATALIGTLYGFSIYSIEAFLVPLNLMNAQPLNIFHVAGMLLLFFSWVAFLFYGHLEPLLQKLTWPLKFYVYMLNLSQPHPKTITAHRNDYTYL
jgi:NAD(P)H-quinone oxidoreductase subunit 5